MTAIRVAVRLARRDAHQRGTPPRKDGAQERCGAGGMCARWRTVHFLARPGGGRERRQPQLGHDAVHKQGCGRHGDVEPTC